MVLYCWYCLVLCWLDIFVLYWLDTLVLYWLDTIVLYLLDNLVLYWLDTIVLYWLDTLVLYWLDTLVLYWLYTSVVFIRYDTLVYWLYILSGVVLISYWYWCFGYIYCLVLYWSGTLWYCIDVVLCLHTTIHITASFTRPYANICTLIMVFTTKYSLLTCSYINGDFQKNKHKMIGIQLMV